MKIPQGYTEAQVLAAIEKAVAILAPSFVFGYYDLDDIKQHGRMEAIEALNRDKFDPARPLENFLYTSIRNKYINLLRDKLRRNDPPCRRCADGDYCCGRRPCEKFQVWLERNNSKSNLVRPLGLDHIADEAEPNTRTESTVEEDVETRELLRLIDTKLPAALRDTYLQVRAGVKVPAAKRRRVEDAVRDILGGSVQWPRNAGD